MQVCTTRAFSVGPKPLASPRCYLACTTAKARIDELLTTYYALPHWCQAILPPAAESYALFTGCSFRKDVFPGMVSSHTSVPSSSVHFPIGQHRLKDMYVNWWILLCGTGRSWVQNYVCPPSSYCI
jgi:hypothetical protein